MATKADKKNVIRQGIIDSAKIYSQNLAGKAFLYVYGDEYFEVFFPKMQVYLNMIRCWLKIKIERYQIVLSV